MNVRKWVFKKTNLINILSLIHQSFHIKIAVIGHKQYIIHVANKQQLDGLKM